MVRDQSLSHLLTQTGEEQKISLAFNELGIGREPRRIVAAACFAGSLRTMNGLTGDQDDYH